MGIQWCNVAFSLWIIFFIRKRKKLDKKNKLTGVLTKYPIDIGVYDWAIEHDLFIPKEDKHKHPSFIGSFTSASMDHYHFLDGEEE